MTRVLIVDNDDDNLEMFSNALQHEGFNVNGYTDATTALLNFKPNYYDLVILDDLLPTLNGLQLYNKLRNLDKSINAVLLTEIQKIVGMGNQQGVRIIKKPIFPSKLVGAIKQILNSNRTT